MTGGGRLLAALASAELAAADTLYGPEARVDLDILWIFIGEVRSFGTALPLCRYTA